MNEPNQVSRQKKKSFWDTTIGFFTKLSAFITAIGAIVVGIQKLIPENKHNEDLIVVDTSPKPIINNIDSIRVVKELNDSTEEAGLLENFLKNCVRRNYDEIILRCSVPFYFKYDILTSVP